LADCGVTNRRPMTKMSRRWTTTMLKPNTHQASAAEA
jgi:hypothetical protein